jgi:hypothetical protein
MNPNELLPFSTIGSNTFAADHRGDFPAMTRIDFDHCVRGVSVTESPNLRNSLKQTLGD